MRYEICYEVNDVTRVSHFPNQYVDVRGDSIFFNGGYLQVFDPGLQADVDDWEIDLGPDDMKSQVPQRVVTVDLQDFALLSRLLSSSLLRVVEILGLTTTIYYGENIRLEADIELVPTDEDPAFYPIFYFPQESNINLPNNIILGEYAQGINRVALWRISESTEILTSVFRLEGPHLLVVSEDRNRPRTTPIWNENNLERPYFETVINAVAVAPQYGNDPNESHMFGTGWRKFYIGYAPNKLSHVDYVNKRVEGLTADHLLRKAKKKTFVGYVRRIVFDPNASCIGC